MSYNYGFSSVFSSAAIWGAIGSIFTAALFLRYNRPLVSSGITKPIKEKK